MNSCRPMVEMVYRSTHPPQQTGRATRPGPLSQRLLIYGEAFVPLNAPAAAGAKSTRPGSLSQQLLAYGTMLDQTGPGAQATLKPTGEVHKQHSSPEVHKQHSSVLLRSPLNAPAVAGAKSN